MFPNAIFFRRTDRAAGLALAALLGCAPLVAQERVNLTPRFVEGRVIYVELTQRSEQSVSGGGLSEPRTGVIETTQGVLQKVVGRLPNGSTQLILTFDRMRQAVSGAGQSGQFDSDGIGPGSAPVGGLSAALATMIGKSVALELDAENKVVAFVGMNAIAKQMAGVAGDDPAFAAMAGDLDDEAAKFLWGTARLALFPFREVAVGETWKRTLRQRRSAGNDQLYEYDCVLKSVSSRDGRTLALVEYRGRIRQDAEQPPRRNAQGALLKLESGEFSGAATFDVERGEFIEQNTTADLKASLALPRDEQGQETILRLAQHVSSRTRILSEVQRRQERAAATGAPASRNVP